MQRKLIYVAFSCSYFSSPSSPTRTTFSTGMNLFSEVPLVHTARLYVQVACETRLCSPGSNYESGFSTCESNFEALKCSFYALRLKSTVMSKGMPQGVLYTLCNAVNIRTSNQGNSLSRTCTQSSRVITQIEKKIVWQHFPSLSKQYCIHAFNNQQLHMNWAKKTFMTSTTLFRSV